VTNSEPFVTAYDGDEDDSTNTTDDTDTKVVTETTDDQIPEGYLTQEQVNKIVQKRLDRERKAWQEKNETLLSQLKELEKQTQMPEKERKALRAKIEELQTENMS